MKPTNVQDFLDYAARRKLVLDTDPVTGCYTDERTIGAWDSWLYAHGKYYADAMRLEGAIHMMRRSVQTHASAALGEVLA